jgi:hypothetical protein
VQPPCINLVRRMFELSKTVCDPAKLAPRGGSSNLDDNFASRNILPTRGGGVVPTRAGGVAHSSRIQWICPLTADEWVDSGAPATRGYLQGEPCGQPEKCEPCKTV